MNPRITAKERALIKGAIRRVFSRSPLRVQAIANSIVNHTDTSRPRVKTWCQCPSCNVYTAKSYMEVDHVIPVVGIQETLEELTWDTVVNRIWCEASNLLALCKVCHKEKSRLENKARRVARKAKDGTGNKKDKLPKRAA